VSGLLTVNSASTRDQLAARRPDHTGYGLLLELT